jgi:HTH-type transcriptional regulator/antitoxin HigA
MNASKAPGEALRVLLDMNGWTQEEFATVIGRSKRMVSDIILGRSGITPETAIALGAAFGNDPREWMLLDSDYRLSLVTKDAAGIEKRARFFNLAPIRDMQRRGWIKEAASMDRLEEELERFFGGAIDDDPGFPIAAKRTIRLPNLNLAERAWCFRARRLATTLTANRFDPKRLDLAERKLRQLAAFPKEARHVPGVLEQFGIRFLVIEPLPGARIDGAAFWIASHPVIATSIRHDRIDGFWFTLMHEFSHIRNNDAFSADTDLIDGTKGIAVTLAEDEAESRANKEAATSLIPEAEMTSFIRRVGPFYSKERIIQFANKIQIHPGIIVGQLQYRDEVGYSALREMLVKIREAVIATALTDGWNQSIPPGLV